MFNKRWALIGALTLAVLVLAACAGGGVQTIVVTEIVEGEPVEVVVTAAPPEEPTPDTIIVCMSQEPDSLYRVVSNMAVTVNVWSAADLKGYYVDRGFFYESQALADTDGDGLGNFPTFESGDAVIEGEGADAVLSVTYRFRDDLVWSDGTAFSVDALIFTREVIIDPDSGATTRGLLEQMTFEKIDDLTLKVTYPAGVLDPLYFQPPFSAEGFTAPLPEHVLGDMAPVDIIESEWARLPNPVLGPYQFVEWVEGDHITLSAVPGWWGGEAKVPNLIFRIISDTNQLLASVLSGECDFATDDGLQLTQLPFIQQSAEQGLIKYDAIPGLVWEHIDFNTFPPESAERDAVPFFADARTRQAVAYGTNRLEMTEQILYGEVQPLNSFLPSDHWAYNTELEGSYPYDPDQARALLEEVGWVDADGDGVREAGAAIAGEFSCGRGSYTIPAGTLFEVDFHTTTGNAMRDALSSLLQSNMADIGIKVNLDLLPASVWFADDGPLTTRTYQIGEFAWVTDPDPGSLSLYLGMNIFKTPDGQFLVASDALAADATLLDGLTPPADFTYAGGGAENWLKFGRPTAEELPEGYSVAYVEQMQDAYDVYEGQNDMGWCDEQAAQLIYDANLTALSPEDRLPHYLEFQTIFRDQLPSLPLFQRVEVTAWGVSLCGPAGGPANFATWNVEDWYFDPTGACAE